MRPSVSHHRPLRRRYASQHFRLIARLGQRVPASQWLQSGPLRVGAAVLAVAVALLAARCAAPSPAAAPTEEEVRAGATATLASRAIAVTNHDKAAYLSTDAAGWFKDADAQRFDNLAALPVAEWSMQLADTQPEALAKAGVPHVYQVTETYELSGVDFQPVTVTRYLTFVQHGGKWLLSSDRDGAKAGLRADTQIWDQGPVSVVRGSRSLVIGLGGEQRLKPFADLADHAAGKAAKVWGAAGWSGDVLVLVPNTQDQVETLLNASPGSLRGVVAITAGEGGKSLTGAPASRVLINPDAFNAEAPDAWQFFFDHELTHVATRAWTTAAVPLWLSEGAADYTGYLSSTISADRKFLELANAVGGGWKPEELPVTDDFHGDGAAVSRTYQISHLACAYIAEKYGQAKLVAFYDAVGSAPEGTADPVDQAFRTVLGTTTKDFTVKWRADVLAEATSVQSLLKKKS
ncbi:hypothetical protein GCM10009838_38030 [Catenulispora subtropica]|uniref:Peptidase MA-like domain-containing protein n=1 Tax=Catenulispora subtropica TaxID=450798 RepID=A0ABN2RT10_9ACTN